MKPRSDHLAEGLALHRAGRLREARSQYERALKANPADPNVFHLLGVLDLASGALDAGERRIRRALQLHPDFADARYNLARLQHQRGQFAEAEACYRAAIAAAPGIAAYHLQLGLLLHQQRRLPDAVECYRSAIAADSTLPDPLYHLARACDEQQQAQAAIDALVTLVALAPDHAAGAARRQLAHLRLHVCDWAAHDADCATLRAEALAGASVTPFHLRAAGATAAEMFAAARTEAARIKPPPSPPRTRHGDGRLRIGYLSSDLHNHPVGVLAVELFERHDRSAFEIIAYSHSRPDPSDFRRRLEAAFDRFTDINADSDAEAARRIAADGIDILVDLNGHSGATRPAILAARPAPVQANMLGYLGPMASSGIDYLIADPFVVPAAMQPFYPERILHLPHCYLPLDMRGRTMTGPLSRSAYGLPETGFVFANFSTAYKIAPPLFAIWMRLLHAVPGSVLWLFAGNATTRANLLREAAAAGIASERLVFAGKLPQPEYLARLAAADLFLDTLPCSACTTGVDALWAGLPILTCAGEIFAGRHAGSALHAAGLPELVTHNLADYEAMAVRLATTPGLLTNLRNRLARRDTPLFDTPTYTTALEALYRRIAA